MLVVACILIPLLVMVALAAAGCWRGLMAFSGVLCLLGFGGVLLPFVLPVGEPYLSVGAGMITLFYSFPILALATMFYFISKPLPKHPDA